MLDDVPHNSRQQLVHDRPFGADAVTGYAALHADPLAAARAAVHAARRFLNSKQNRLDAVLALRTSTGGVSREDARKDRDEALALLKAAEQRTREVAQRRAGDPIGDPVDDQDD